MKKHFIVYIILSLLSISATPLFADDCDDIVDAIRKLRDAKKWQEAIAECESFNRHCDSRGEVENIRQECLKHLSNANSSPIKPSTTNSDHLLDKKSIFNVDKTIIHFPESGGQNQIKVISDNEWNISYVPYWINVQQDGNIITLLCKTNNFSHTRKDELILIDNINQEIHINIQQEKSKDYLNLSSKVITDNTGRGNYYYTIHVTSNKPWKINSKPNWCKVKTTQEAIMVELEQNDSDYDRRGTIEVVSTASNVLQQVITIEQKYLKHFITINPAFVRENSGECGYATINVETDLNYYTIEEVPSWCEIKNRTATSFDIWIKDNSGGQAREAKCKIIAGNVNQTLTIKQGARPNYINISPRLVTATNAGGTITISVQSNKQWHISECPEWCIISNLTEHSFGLEILQNHGEPRQGTVTISAESMKNEVSVEQE